jgi:hypothetical protein
LGIGSSSSFFFFGLTGLGSDSAGVVAGFGSPVGSAWAVAVLRPVASLLNTVVTLPSGPTTTALSEVTATNLPVTGSSAARSIVTSWSIIACHAASGTACVVSVGASTVGSDAGGAVGGVGSVGWVSVG